MRLIVIFVLLSISVFSQSVPYRDLAIEDRVVIYGSPTNIPYLSTNVTDGRFSYSKTIADGNVYFLAPTNATEGMLLNYQIESPPSNIAVTLADTIRIPSSGGLSNVVEMTSNQTYFIQLRYAILKSSTNWLLMSVSGGY